MSEYSLIVSFPDQSETFVLGFEAGMIWEKLQAGILDMNVTVHTTNVEVINRMCAAAQIVPYFTPTEVEGWTTLKFKLHQRPKPDLRLVHSAVVPAQDGD